jgi:type I restriction-modification system DNA methylase subunit
MKVPRLQTGQNLSEYAELLAQAYCREVGVARRKATGQFFTPVKVSDFMAGLFEVRQSRIRLLDPGAGTGTLIAAFCESARAARSTSELTVDACENDRRRGVLPEIQYL